MEGLGYPPDVVALVGDIYAKASTSFRGTHFITTLFIRISRGTIPRDMLNPYLFMIFLEPVFRWLGKAQLDYQFNISPNQIITATYGDDLAILTDNIRLAFTTYFQAQTINYKHQQLPILSHNESYT